MSAPLAYTATIVSAVCFGLASVLEQVATKRTRTINSLNPLGFLPLLKQLPYLSGLVLDGLGFVMFLIAVRALPLFFVQAAETASIAVTALAARYILHSRLSLKEYGLMGLLAVGLVLLGYSAAPEMSSPVSPAFRYGILYAAVGLIVICLVLTKNIRRLPQLTAFMAGLCFSGLAIAGRIIPLSLHPLTLLTNPLLYAIIVYSVLGMLLFSMALQSGSVTRVYAINFVTETVIPTVVGLHFLGDGPRSGLWPVMLIGLAVSIVSASAFALVKDPERHA